MRSNLTALGTGAGIGMGGLIGLGGAEFRLPLLINLFKFRGLEAVILNKATSLIVVASALLFRARTAPLAEIGTHLPVILNLLAGSLVGAYAGASWATRLKSETFHKIIAVLLLLMAGVLLFAHDAAAGVPLLTDACLIVTGVAVGFATGIVASLLGVAGGELLIPALILLFGADVKLAGSLSLAVSLPTMLAGFARYSRDQSFSVLHANWPFMFAMAAGSTIGTFIGSLLLGVVPSSILLPALAAILVISAVKVWRHD